MIKAGGTKAKAEFFVSITNAHNNEPHAAANRKRLSLLDSRELITIAPLFDIQTITFCNLVTAKK